MGLLSKIKSFGKSAMGFLPVAGDLFGAYQSKRAADRSIRGTERANRENIEWQKEFAKHGISWKVEDAARAGLHPMAALGAQVSQFVPSSVSPDTSGFEKMGQKAGSALTKLSTILNPIERKKDMEELRALKLSNDLLQIDKNDRLKSVGSRLRLNETQGVVDGQKDGVVYDPKRVTMKQNRSTQAGIEAYYRYAEKDGLTQMLPTQENQELITEMNPHAVEYWSDWGRNWRRDVHAHSRPNTPAAKKWRRYLRSVWPPAPKGHHYRYVSRHRWKLYKNKGKKYFYADKAHGILQ